MTEEPPPSAAPGPPGPEADPSPESPAERADRNFVEFLQGIRVAVTGVQVLFAFLLTVPFSPGFTRIAENDRRLFYVALVSAAIASMFFIAPVAQHRILFRQGLKEPLVKRANVYGMIGTLALAVSMISATLLVVDYLFDGALPLVTACGVAALAAWLWFIEPSLHRSSRTDIAGQAAGQAGPGGPGGRSAGTEGSRDG